MPVLIAHRQPVVNGKRDRRGWMRAWIGAASPRCLRLQAHRPADQVFSVRPAAGMVPSMNLVIEQAERVPLAPDARGVIRVGGSRVTLDTVASAFERGATPEEIVQQYPTLGLADVYSVLGYLLRHQAEVGAYLCQQAARAAVVRQENEQRSEAQGVRARLLARRAIASTRS